MFGIINIYSKSGNEIGQKLSNFYPHTFTFGGIEFGSFEAFVQCLKFSDPEEQMKVAGMDAKSAKAAGQTQHWQENGGWLYWKGRTINRYGREYQRLLDQAYDALCQNAKFADALRRSRRPLLIHTIGKLRRKDTALTSIEFCRILTRKRRKLLQKGAEQKRGQDKCGP